MKITMAALLSLKPLQEKLKTQIFPVKTTYKFSKLFKRVNEEAEFYTEEVNKIIDQYAVKGEDGKPRQNESGNGILLKPEMIEVAQRKFSDLINLEIDFDDIQFTLDELNDIKLSVEEFGYLLPFINE